ncbi:MAG: hypothetical protein H7X92_05215 [Chitinophagales bacterium]|nr:hypothetical protein [Hyphomicrobiales bacterium]
MAGKYFIDDMDQADQISTGYRIAAKAGHRRFLNAMTPLTQRFSSV